MKIIGKISAVLVLTLFISLTFLGAVKISADLTNAQQRVVNIAWLVGGGALFGVLLHGLLLRLFLQRSIIAPLKALSHEAARMADGDLSFALDSQGGGDIRKLQDAIKASLSSVSSILRRVTEVTKRVAEAADRVEKDSGQVVDFTQREAHAIAEISSSVAELNASIKAISENVEGLALAVEETAVSMEEMAASLESVGAIVHDLSDGVDTTSASVEELSATFQEVAAGAGELENVTETTLSAVEQIIGSIGAIEEKVKESARLSERVTTEASTIGVAAMAKSSKGMERIKGSVEKTAGALKLLDGRSEEIGKILTVIDEVTDQTTLLALNAAIIAAQAGTQGAGFSVVADEMKGLAGRTAVSTEEIAALIDAVRAEVRSAVESMHEALRAVAEGEALAKEAATSFGTILDNARSSSEMTLAIERTTVEQAQAAGLISKSVEQVRRMVHHMTRTTAEQSKGVAQIMHATEKIRDASQHVRNSSDQQRTASSQIAQAVDAISGKSQQIALALNEQKQGSAQICAAIEQIKDIPHQSKDIAFRVNRTLREVVKDVELIDYELNSFTLHEADRDILRFGIVPVESPVDMYQRYTPLAGYLSARLDRKVELRIAPNFETALRELGEGITSICSMTSMIYIEAQKHYGAETLATVMRNGKSWHHSVIVTRADSGIKTLSELRDTAFAFVDAKAAAGYVMPRAMLLDAGVTLQDLAYYNFTGAHDEVAKAVLRGEFTAGGLMESTAKKYRDQGLIILKNSEQVPEWNICCRGLDGPVKKALQDALLDLDEKTPEGAKVLHAIEAGCAGFVKSSDADHNGMRAMMTKIGIF